MDYVYYVYNNIIMIYFVLAALIAINFFAFLYIGSDKKRSIDHAERVREINFFVWAIFFGSLGVLAGMFFFHHKTKKLNFVFGISTLLIQQLALTYLLTTKLI